MKRWEYFHAFVRNLYVYEEKYQPLPKPWKLERYLLEQGFNGWELSGVVPERDGQRLIFKRELSGEKQVEYWPNEDEPTGTIETW